MKKKQLSMHGTMTGRVIIFVLWILILCIHESLKIQHYHTTKEICPTIMEYFFLILYNGAYMPYAAMGFLLFAGEIKPHPFRKDLEDEKKLHICNSILAPVNYTVTAAVLLCVIALIVSFLFGKPGIEWTSGFQSVIPPFIVNVMSPISAALLSLLVVILFWLEIVLFLSTMNKVGILFPGLLICLVAIHWDSIWFGEGVPAWLPVRSFTLKAMLHNYSIGNGGKSISNGMIYLLTGVIILGILNVIVFAVKSAKE